jgi:hypothetical protein
MFGLMSPEGKKDDMGYPQLSVRLELVSREMSSSWFGIVRREHRDER